MTASMPVTAPETRGTPLRRSQHRLQSTVAALEWLLLIAAVLFFVLRTLPQTWRVMQSDFPNYYVAARLTRERMDTSRLYEWIWFQRQKDRMGISQPLVGAATLTPFSFLVAVPLSCFEPLAAKQIWTVANLLFLLAMLCLLRSLTVMTWKHLALLSLLWIPLHSNLRLGQMYILLLLVMTAALWCYIKGKPLACGVLIAIAFGLKIFPVLFVLYFVRKKDWRALAGVALGTAVVIVSVIAVYGFPTLSHYGTQQLPAALRGESLDPYNLLRNSPSALLHRLFIYEPDLNPAPALDSPLLYAALHPLIQLLIVAPALLLLIPKKRDDDRTKLEWAAFLTALLAISTNSAFYQYAVLLLPAAILLSDSKLKTKRLFQTALIICLIGVCFPGWGSAGYNGWRALLGVPRLYFLLALCVIMYTMLYRREATRFSRSHAIWAALLLCGYAISFGTTIKHQRHLYDDYSHRVALNPSPLLQLSPETRGGISQFIAMTENGYQLREISSHAALHKFSEADELSFTSTDKLTIIERTNQDSQLVSSDNNKVMVNDGFNPALSPDGIIFAFLRATHGKGTVWLKDPRTGAETALPSPPGANVADLAYAPDGTLLASSIQSGDFHIFALTSAGQWHQLTTGDDRYPAVSPDGRWLAFSRSNGRVWNLWIQDRTTKRERRLFAADCNQITPAWAEDSQTLLYASDCGRGLNLTALAQRRVIDGQPR